MDSRSWLAFLLRLLLLAQLVSLLLKTPLIELDRVGREGSVSTGSLGKVGVRRDWKNAAPR